MAGIIIKLKRSKGDPAKGTPDQFYHTIQSGSENIGTGELVKNYKDAEKGPRAILRMVADEAINAGHIKLMDYRKNSKGVRLDIPTFITEGENT